MTSPIRLFTVGYQCPALLLDIDCRHEQFSEAEVSPKVVWAGGLSYYSARTSLTPYWVRKSVGCYRTFELMSLLSGGTEEVLGENTLAASACFLRLMLFQCLSLCRRSLRTSSQSEDAQGRPVEVSKYVLHRRSEM